MEVKIQEPRSKGGQTYHSLVKALSVPRAPTRLSLRRAFLFPGNQE